MKSSARSSTERRLLEYGLMRGLGPLESASIIELTATLQYAIEAELPNTLTKLLGELGRRGGLAVAVQAVSRPLPSPRPGPAARTRA
jgi:hypothetical protein